MKQNRTIMQYFEVMFDLFYLCAGLGISIYLLVQSETPAQICAGIMGMILIGGDSFHLIPRVLSILNGDKTKFRRALGIGKLITSVTMTVFYLFLWHIALLLFSPPNSGQLTVLIYALAAVRITLCLVPQNKWTQEHPPVKWGVIRNIPFVLEGLMVILVFYVNRAVNPELGLIWLAVLLSFLCYLPVVLWADKNPKIGMLMLPKTVMYLWILVIFLRI